MSQSTVGNAKENLLSGYKFTINDFTVDQVNQLKRTCLKFYGNKTLKKELNHLINLQNEEKHRYYKLVSKKRRQNASKEKQRSLLRKLQIPENWISMFGNTPVKNKKPFVVWEEPAPLDEMAERKFSKLESMAGLQPGSVGLSGWERLKRAFLPNYFVPNYSFNESSHIYNVRCLLNCGLGAGLVFGLIMAYQHARRFVADFDRTNLSNMYASKYDAHKTRHNVFVRGYVRYTTRWGLRVGFLFGTIVLVSQALAIYRLKDAASHYVVAAAAPFGLYRWARGPRVMLVNGVVGATVLGLPLGLLIAGCGINPRPVLYDAGVHPELSSPHHWYNWTEEERDLSRRRMNAILEELALNIDEEEAKKREVYKDLVATYNI